MFEICIMYVFCFLTVASSVILGFVSIVFLKLVSYHMVNYWCRQSPVSSAKTRRRSASSDRSKSKSKTFDNFEL